ncbi:MAG: Dps family protein [Simkaniaceae bacterium]
MHTGIEENDRKMIADGIEKILANTYTIYLKTQHYHWNITGKEFYSLHLLFQKQYEELAETIDEMAERVRALGFYPIGSFSLFLKNSEIKEETETKLASDEILRRLLKDHETLIRIIRKHLPLVEKLHDGATADFLNKRLDSHEKSAWMIRSSL